MRASPGKHTGDRDPCDNYQKEEEEGGGRGKRFCSEEKRRIEEYPIATREWRLHRTHG